MRRARALRAVGALLPVLALLSCTTHHSGPRHTASAPGITPTTVTIGSTQPLSGITVPGVSEIAPASAAYFAYVNAHGGVNGRTITYTYVDDAARPHRTQAQTQSLLNRYGVFAMFNAFGTSTHEQVVRTLNAAHVPDVFVGSGCPCWNDAHRYPYTFGWQPDYTVEGKILGAYVAHSVARTHKKIAYFSEDDDFGRAGVAGLDREVPHGRVVTRQTYRPGRVDISAQVRRMQAAGADVVVAFASPTFTALLKLNMLKLRYSPRLVVSSSGSDPATVARLVELFGKQGRTAVRGRDVIQGIVTDGYLASLADPSDSWVALFRKVHDSYLSHLPFDANVEYGMAVAYTFVEALQKAGVNPTRDGLVRAVESGLPQAAGLVPFLYSSTSHAGYAGAQIGVIRGMAVRPTGAPQVTDDGDGPIRTVTATPPAAPVGGVPLG